MGEVPECGRFLGRVELRSTSDRHNKTYLELQFFFAVDGSMFATCPRAFVWLLLDIEESTILDDSAGA